MEGKITKYPHGAQHKGVGLHRRQLSIDATIMRIININLSAPFLGNIMWRFAAIYDGKCLALKPIIIYLSTDELVLSVCCYLI